MPPSPVSCLPAVYAFYRLCESAISVATERCGIATGLALAAKHTGLLVLPMLLLLAVYEVVRTWIT